ncbi:MAG: hypothetical protein IPK17_37365 [Chloroflexi bacterium]|uniref:hypothetical protein n=1 Tax=Candidatus Flexifilum breve TaxID=3140694 RepID=UPI003135FD2F|nr:hypothetical protein [Chloroflexota bacterium]
MIRAQDQRRVDQPHIRPGARSARRQPFGVAPAAHPADVRSSSSRMRAPGHGSAALSNARRSSSAASASTRCIRVSGGTGTPSIPDQSRNVTVCGNSL